MSREKGLRPLQPSQILRRRSLSLTSWPPSRARWLARRRRGRAARRDAAATVATAARADAPRRAPRSAGAGAAPRRPRGPDADALPAATGLPPERRALQVVDGRDRIVDADVARARGLTLVDLSDGWAPRIFADGVAADGARAAQSLPRGLRRPRQQQDRRRRPAAVARRAELPRAVRHPADAVGAARALPGRRRPRLRSDLRRQRSCWRSTRSRPGARRRSRRSWPSSTRARSGWRRRA